jgi:stage V sporulation protein S
MDLIKVSATSRTSAVAGAIAGVIREHKHAEVRLALWPLTRP